MAYYNMQGPAQYQQYQQSRKDQQMSNLLRMMMQMKALKQRKGQFEAGQEQWEQNMALKQQQQALSQKQYEDLAKHRGALQKQWEKPPKSPDWWTLAQTLVRTGQAENMGTAVMMAKKIKKEKSLEERVTEVTAIDTAKERVKQRFKEPPSTKPKELTPAQKLSNRLKIKGNLTKRWTDILGDTDLDKNLELHRASENIHMDMPRRYTLFQSYVKEGVAKKEEVEYIAKAEETKGFLERHPEIYSLKDIAPGVKARLDLATIRTLLEYRKKPRGKFLGIF